MTTYIDNAKRKKIVMFWVPLCLTILHVWGSLLIGAVVFFGRDNSTISGMFSTCGFGIAALILLLISDKGLEFIISRVGGLAEAQTIEKTTTETTTIKPAATPAGTVENVDIQAENVNVSRKEPTE